MQRLTWAFRLVAHNEKFKTWEKKLSGWLVGCAGPFKAELCLFGCQPLIRYSNLFLPVVRILLQHQQENEEQHKNTKNSSKNKDQHKQQN
jgi:hypothetical protein